MSIDTSSKTTDYRKAVRVLRFLRSRFVCAMAKVEGVFDFPCGIQVLPVGVWDSWACRFLWDVSSFLVVSVCSSRIR